SELRALIDRGLDLLGQRDVRDEEPRKLEAVAGELRREELLAVIRQLVVFRGDVECGDLRLRDRIRKAREDRRAKLPGDLVGRREPCRSDDRREERLRVGDL